MLTIYVDDTDKDDNTDGDYCYAEFKWPWIYFKMFNLE